MAAASHLERMGRELKCPICLSLLNSAVSLTCNHVFCNPCIEKSMKAASNCPVCKLPYRRREIRPAPHMDNLVNVYKSMEVASGVNIFITQNAASTKIFGEDNQTGIHTREAQHNGNTHIMTLGSCSQKQHQGKGSKVASHTDQRSSRSNLVKPSFPTKKRVQVSPYPTSEARMEPEKLESGNVEIDQTKYKKFQKDMSVTCEKGEPLFSPFFWLREEEDLEKSTQQTDDNQLMYTPPDVPCFSDIKDSDDEVSDKISPKRADCIIRNNADFIDSEMFDWTQRPCSPELCSAPLAMQIQDTEEQDKTEEKAEAALMETTTGSKISANKREILHKKKKANKSSENKGPTITCTKKVSNATETRKRKRAKKTICEVTTTDIESDKVIMLQGENSSLLTSKRKPQENEQICSEASNQDKSAVTLSDGTELLPNRNKTRASTKKVGNAAETKKGKRAKKTVCEVPVANIESDKVAIEEGDNGNSLTLKKKPRKNEKISSEASIQDKSALTLSHGTELLPNSNKLRASTKKVSNATETRKSKSAMCEVTVANVELDKVTMQEDGNGNPVNLKRKPRKNEKKCSAASIEDKNAPPLSDGTELQANSNKYAHANDTTCEDIEKSRKKNSNLGRSSKRKCTSKTLVQTEKYGNKVKTGPGRGRLHTEQNNEGLISQLHAIWLPSGNEKEVSDRNTEKAYEDNNKKMPNSLKKVTFSVEDMPKDRCDGISLSANDKDAMRSQTFQETVGATEQLGMRNTAKMDQASSTLNGSILLKCKKSPSTICCAFCQSSDESEASGIMVHYLNRKPVVDNQQASTKVVHVHKNCTEWAPNVYFEDDNVINLETELSRSRRITCSCCGIKGAALGCYEKSCRKSFHVSCARLTPECRWDSENFVMLCPIHASCQLPNEKPRSHSRKKRKSAIERKSCTPQAKTTEECKSGSTLPWKSQKKFRNMVLCCSALTDVEKAIITEFEKLSGVTMLKNWDSSITHVIASTDENGACRRTLKFLMGVLEGKWILNVQWIKACIEAGELVDEQHYEISSDINGIREGPRLGRLRLLNKQPKLFEAYTFFFMGDFAPSYRGYLHDLVIAAGGKVLNRKPIAGNHETNVIIYSIELPDQSQASILDQRRAQAEELANSAEAVVASNSWVLNSIAGYKLQNIRE